MPLYRVELDETRQSVTVMSGSFGPFDAPLPPSARAVRSLRLFVDGSLLELFVDDQVALTTRCYGSAPSQMVVTGA